MNLDRNSQIDKQSNKTTIKLSKFLSLILRHKPDIIGLTLDARGWADVDVLIKLARQHGRQINRSLLEQIVANNNKKRFAFNKDKTKIRANQGHSIPVDLTLTPQQPPEYLYHGTATRFLDSIYSRGLVRQNRHHVHLSANRVTAIEVGKRHGKPAILKIAAEKMHDAGLEFFLTQNNVWLTDSVPPKYISSQQ